MLIKPNLTKVEITIPKHQKPPKTPFYFPKKALLISVFVILGIGFGIYAVFPEPRNEEDYLLELINRIEGGEELPSGELKDYCHLMAVLRDSISPECVCVLDGINWDNPPKIPERLPDAWEEFSKTEDNSGNRTYFRHKQYPKIVIGFDAKDKNGNDKPHWHRENPNSNKKKFPYLDKNCGLMWRGAPNSHIYTRK